MMFLAKEGLILKASRSSHTQQESGSVPAKVFFQVPQGSSGDFHFPSVQKIIQSFFKRLGWERLAQNHTCMKIF